MTDHGDECPCDEHGETAYGIEKCTCGDKACNTYWLTGIGSFCQGSGFKKDEAEQIVAALRQGEVDRARVVELEALCLALECEVSNSAADKAAAEAQLAEVTKELEEARAKMRMIVSHASGGWTQDIEQSTNDICVQISANRNTVYEAGIEKGRKEAESRLSEAVKALEDIASGRAFRQQRFAEDDDADYFLRAQRSVQKLAAEVVKSTTLSQPEGGEEASYTGSDWRLHAQQHQAGSETGSEQQSGHGNASASMDSLEGSNPSPGAHPGDAGSEG